MTALRPAGAVVAIALAAASLAACTARLGGSGERIEREFYAAVSRDVEAGVEALSPSARRDLAGLLPVMRREATWDGVLDVLDEHPTLDPFEDSIRGSIRTHSDARTQIEISTSGDRRLRDTILSTIDNALTLDDRT